MNVRLFIIFSPFLVGLLLFDPPELSIAWSLAGSVCIACIAQTNWFMESSRNESFTDRLLRPASMFHFMFVSYHIFGGAIHAMNGAGYSIFGTSVSDPTYDPAVVSQCQQLMLLAHASVTAGMKLVGFSYDRPQYRLRSIPPYLLILVSLVSFGISTATMSVAGLQNFASGVAGISVTAILVEIVMCLQHRRHNNLVVALVLLGMNLFSQAVSGWKGLLLFTMITLGALLYHLMPRRVIVGGAAFLLFWALYFYPFGLALRPLLWYGGVSQDTAVEMSISQTLGLSLEERLNLVWGAFADRLNDLSQFRKYVEYVPEVRPYYGFDIVDDAVIALVPRVLWPEKPNMEAVSMQRVYEAGVVSEQSIVSAKSSFYQDAYLSGGEMAIVLACVSLGVFMMWISRACERLFGGYEIGTCLIYTSLFARTFHMTPNFEYFVGSVWMSLALMFALFFLGRSTGWIVRASEPEDLWIADQANISERPARVFPSSSGAGY